MTAVRRVWQGLACALALCLSFFASEGTARFAQQGLAELRATSDLIVTGTLTAARADPVPELPGLEIRRLRIDRVLAGPESGSVPLATPAPGPPVSSSDIRYPNGATGLWFLRARPTSIGPVYMADTPQCFVPAAKADAMFDALDAANTN